MYDVVRKLALVLVLLLASAAAADWPMYRFDAARTGATGPGPGAELAMVWNYTTGFPVYSSPAVVDGTVFVGSWDGKVYALDARTGEEVWTFDTGTAISSSPAVHHSVVFVGAGDGMVYSLDGRAGYEEWKYETGASISSSPAVAGGIVYIGSDDHFVYALNETTGALVWKVDTGQIVDSSPVVVDGVVYIGSDDWNVYALDAATGTEVWRFATEGEVDGTPAVVDGTLYIGSYDNNVYALDARTGAEIWRSDVESDIVGAVAVADGRVYVGSDGNEAVALDARTGKRLWRFVTESLTSSSPAVADGVVYVGSSDWRVYALDAETGKLLWNHTTGREVVSSAAIANGMMYIGSGDRRVYAFGKAAPEPTPTPEPTPNATIEATPPPEPLANGETCSDDSGCVSENCRNGVCCIIGRDCCVSDRDCGPDESCDTERSYCVTREGATGAVAFLLENIELFLGLFAVLSAAGYYLHLLKRRALGEEAVSVKRGVTREGNMVKIGVKVVNDSTFALVDVGVELDVPEAFTIEGGSKYIDLGTVKQGEFQSALFRLVPNRCVSGNITGSVQYHDLQGERKVVEMSPVSVTSVCPFLEPAAITAAEFNERIAGLAGTQERMFVPGDRLQAVMDALQGKCSAMYPVLRAQPGAIGGLVGMFAASGAYSKRFIAMRLDRDPTSGDLTVTVYGEQTEMVTGLMAEMVELIQGAGGAKRET